MTKFQELPVYELKINESLNDDSEVSYVALVDMPAIKKDFLAFKEESQEFINPSKGEHKDEFLQRCIKYVIDEGKSSEQAVAICNSLWDEHFASDFASEKISIDYDDTLSTSRGKELGSIGNKFDTLFVTKKFSQFQIISEDEKIISGPLMLADELIYRNNDTFGEHYVKFTADTIKEISIKFAKKKYQANVNLMHDQNQIVEGVTMFESFIVDKKRGILPMKGFEDVADGSWFGSFYVENPDVWNKIKSGELKGFSVEGLFDYEEPKQTVKQLSVEEETLNYIAELLKDI